MRLVTVHRADAIRPTSLRLNVRWPNTVGENTIVDSSARMKVIRPKTAEPTLKVAKNPINRAVLGPVYF